VHLKVEQERGEPAKSEVSDVSKAELRARVAQVNMIKKKKDEVRTTLEEANVSPPPFYPFNSNTRT